MRQRAVISGFPLGSPRAFVLSGQAQALDQGPFESRYCLFAGERLRARRPALGLRRLLLLLSRSLPLFL